jgi:hypothetical protein
MRCITMEGHDQDSNRNVASITRKLLSLGYTVRFKRDYLERHFLHHLLAAHGDALRP